MSARVRFSPCDENVVIRPCSRESVRSPKFLTAWTVHKASVPTLHAPDNKMDACFEERLFMEIYRDSHLGRNLWSTSHTAGVLLRTQGSAVSNVKLFEKGSWERCKQHYRRTSNRPTNTYVLSENLIELSFLIFRILDYINSDSKKDLAICNLILNRPGRKSPSPLKKKKKTAVLWVLYSNKLFTESMLSVGSTLPHTYHT